VTLLMQFRKVLILVAGLLLPVLGVCGAVPDGQSTMAHQMVRENVELPAVFKADDGSSVTFDLDGIVVRPDDDQKHPLVVINHGYHPDPERIFADNLVSRAIEFAHRGWVAVVFSRRGYGLSDGRFVEKRSGCNVSEFIRVGQESAKDIHEVIRLMQKKSYVDATKVISVGAMGGGYASIAATINPPPGLIAVVSFSVGFLVRNPQQISCYQQSQIDAAAFMGQRSRIPVLWIQPEHDHVISFDLGKRMYQAFTAAGGRVEFVDMAAFDNADYALIRDGVSIWAPYVDAFLQKQGIKQMEVLIPLSNIRRVYSQ
jgi:dienelactone hydrolase